MRPSIEQWILAASLPRVDKVLGAIHAEIEEWARGARPLCVASGRCCRFEAFGHRLYVSGLETAWCLRRLAAIDGRHLAAAELDAAVAAGTCPFLRDGLCTVHRIRPFACRTFFCDPRSGDEQRELHERVHDRVRRLHDEVGVEYRYGEWRSMLALFVHVEATPTPAPPRAPGNDEDGS